jgi:hypothetical protein
MAYKFYGIFLLLASLTFSQGLFENAGNEIQSTSEGSKKGFNLSGYVKGALYGNDDASGDASIQGAYAELALKVEASKASLGKAFAEVRFVPGMQYGAYSFLPDIREAWVATSPGPFKFVLGKKILAWGRADGINPTNNLTPMNSLVLSSEYDDTRLGAMLAQASVRIKNVTIEGVWLPLYSTDSLLLDRVELPAQVTIEKHEYPGPKLENSGFALRCDLTFPKVDGSLSYFNGYETQPGFDYAFNRDGITLTPTAYRVHVIGMDFSTAIGSFGIRGEGAVTLPFDEPEKVKFVPNRHAAYILGVDRDIGDFSFLVQYSGVAVFEFDELPQPVLLDPTAQMMYAAAQAEMQMQQINRLFTGTADKASHSVTARIGWRGFQETLAIELAGLYNFTTEEYAVNPNLSYDIADALTVSLGGRLVRGPEETLNDLASDLLTNAYVELKYSF